MRACDPILVTDRDCQPCAVVIFDPSNPFTNTGWMIYPFSLVYGWIAEKLPDWKVEPPYRTCEVNSHHTIGGPLPSLFENIYCIHCVKGDPK